MAGGVEGAHWLLIASKGDQENKGRGTGGKTGKQGIQGERGLTSERGVQGIQGHPGTPGRSRRCWPGWTHGDGRTPRACRPQGRAASTAWPCRCWHGQFQRDRRGASVVPVHRNEAPTITSTMQASMPKHSDGRRKPSMPTIDLARPGSAGDPQGRAGCKRTAGKPALKAQRESRASRDP